MAVEKALRHYLVRHGEAKADMEDSARPLSDRGRDEIQRVARHAAILGLEVAQIRHSGKVRARQTAEILAEHLAPRLGIRQIEGLAPGDAPDRARAELEAAGEPLMLVGHLPHLSRLVSALVLGDNEEEIIWPDTGTMVCLAKTERGFRLLWVLTPELAQA
ncbi:phosphohistidine phosphatase SixA [Candidatus Methylomirabilis limnetica]|uniref:Phosphohistidine phosphatase SixA n=1 Tax=Candidatus Methylomirabilis limnetica TaxID=2033718 RepID=A0A2T4TYB1_9BACT|nr:phosphohistidine phosphatase SixA [Candidatus Methylomirabilis limnetica]PTL36090.1 phosphohistidine phosphatase SixA [Candidatus Methylomirabilis limnetica]